MDFIRKSFCKKMRVLKKTFPGVLLALSLIFAAKASAQLAALQITTMNPPGIGQGAVAKNVAIYGTGFQCGVQMVFPSGTGITATPFQNQCPTGVVSSNVQYFSSSNVFVYLTVPSTTSSGNITVTFINPNGVSGTANLIINPAPAITSVTNYPPPSTSSIPAVVQGGTLSIKINGTGFQNGATLSFSEAGITTNSFYLNATGSGVAALTVSSSVYPSLKGLTLTNPDGGNTLFPGALLVQPALGTKTPALTVYEDPRLLSGTYRIPFVSFWNGGWSQEANILPSQSFYTPSEMVLKPHPSIFQQIMAHSIGSYIEFQVWNHGSWGNQWITTVYSSSSGTKNFDVAFESRSGNGLIVYGTVTGLYYRRFLQNGPATNCDSLVSGNVAPPCWGPENSIPTAINFTSAFPARITLLSNPDTTKNEILMAYQDNSSCTPSCGRLYLRAWDGTQFSPEQLVSPSTRIDTTPFDLAYMQTSKKGMLAWLEVNNVYPQACVWSGTACVLTSALAPPSSPAWAGTAGTKATTDLFRIQLSSDPASDQIALGALQDTPSAVLTAQIWNGTVWPSGSYPANLNAVYTVNNQLNYLSPYNDWNDFNLLWKPNGAGSRLFAIYNNSSGGLHYQTWFPGSGWNGDQSVPGIPLDTSGFTPALPMFVSIGFDSDPRSGDILGVMKGSNSLFSSIRWDGNNSGWFDYKLLVPGGSTYYVVPFGFSYFRDFPTMNTAAFIFQQGSSATVTISGTLIQDGATLAFPGFTPSSLTSTTVSHGANGQDTIAATGTIDNLAIPGVYDLTITNPDRTLAVGKGFVTITANPQNAATLFSVSPNSRGQGAVNQTLTFSGYNLPSPLTVSFLLNGTADPNITVNTPQPVSPVTVGPIQQFTLQVNVGSSASAGPRDIQIRAGSQVFTFPALFTVNYGPSIIGMTPASLTQGVTNAAISITGSDFKTGATLFVPDGAQSLGWNTPGGLSTSFYQNKMTGNNFYIPAPTVTTTSVILNKILFQTNLVDPIKTNGQVAVYDDLTPLGAPGNGKPGNLVATSVIQPLSSTVLTGINVFQFSLTTPINLTVPARYWVLVNVEGFQTLLTYDNNKLTCNGDTFCTGVVSWQTFGTWPQPRGDGSTTLWSTQPKKKYGISLWYCYGSPLKCNIPQIGTPVGSISEGPDSNQMTGSRFTTATTANVKGMTFYVNTVDPTLDPVTGQPLLNQGSAAIYSDAIDPVTGNHYPGNLILATSSQALVAQSFNTILFSTQPLPPGTYWLLVNVNGPGTTLTYDDGPPVNSVKQVNAFTNPWPNPGGAGWTLNPGRRYAVAVVPDVSLSNFNVISGNSMSGTVSTDLFATTGLRQICVMNPDGGQGCTQPNLQIVGKTVTQPALTAYGSALSNAPAYRRWRGYAPWEIESNSPVSSGGTPLWTVLRSYPHAYLNGNPQNKDPRSGEKLMGTVNSTFGLPAVLTIQVWDGNVWGFPLNLTTSPTFSRSYDVAYESGTGRAVAVYGVSGNPAPQFQIWTGTNWIPAQAINSAANPPGNTVLWVRLEPNPNPASNEIILAYLSGDVTVDAQGNTVVNSNIVLHTWVWNGAAFGNERTFNFPAVNINLCGNCTPPILTQPFDIAYEHLTDRALLSWGYTGNSTPGYIIWNDPKNPLQWSTSSQANRAAGDTGTSLIYFKLSGDPNSNQIAMGTGTLNGQYYVQLWNGSNWGPPAVRSGSAPGPFFSLSGEWSSTPVVSPPASAGTGQLSHLASDFADFTFSGTEINLIGQKNAILGAANIYLDGQLKDRVDQYYPSPTERMALYSLTNLSNTTHTLRVQPSGLRNVLAPFPGGTQTDASADTITGTVFTAQKDGYLTRLSLFLNSVDPAYPLGSTVTCGALAVPAFEIAVYSDNGGVPGNLLGQPTQSCKPQAPAWNSTIIPVNSYIPVTGGTKYWILVNVNGSYPGTTLTYSPGSSAAVSVKLGQLFGTGTGIWPASFSPTTAWGVSTGRYYSLYGGSNSTNPNLVSDISQNLTILEQVNLGVAPSVAVDSFDVKKTLDSPSVASTNLLYYSSPANPGAPDPTSIGRNFDLAWEKDSGRLLTVFGSSNSVNACLSTPSNTFPYSTRFRKWEAGTGWSADALVPLVGADLIPRWLQLSADTTSNDLFLGVSGPSTVYSLSSGCTFGPQNYHQYLWHGGAWVDKEILSVALGGSFQPLFSNPGNGASAYTESFMAAFDNDNSPPAPVSDLIVTSVTPNSATLQWIAPGDDFSNLDQVSLGKVAGYTLAWTTGASTNTTTVLPTRFAGETETFTVVGLAPATSYTFSLTSADKAGNVSALSINNPSTKTLGGVTGSWISPGVITDFMVIPGSLSNNSVQLTWTAPVITSSYSGTMKPAYDLRWAYSKITDDSSFNNATRVLANDGTGRNGLPASHTAGTREFFSFTSVPKAVVYFAIKICDPGAVDPMTLTCPTGAAENIYPLNLTPKNYPFDLTPVPLSVQQVSVDNTGSMTGNISPSAITDLAITRIDTNSMTLRWTVPSNTAQYDIRYSTAPITSGNFSTARQVYSIPLPVTSGMPQSLTVTNLLSNTASGITYYFAIETINSAGVSLSNVVSGTTFPVFDFTSPAPITDLSILPEGTNKNSVLLSWTATGDDGSLGRATQYDIRYSELPIVENGIPINPNRQVEFQNAIQVAGPPPPLPAGNKEFYTVTGLDSNTVYYFAVKAIDKASNYSGISTCLNCPGHTALHSGYNLVSVPYRLSGVKDPASVFGNDVSKPVTIYQWNNGAYSVPFLVAEGAGYFLYAIGNNSVLKASDAGGNLLGTPETGATVTVPLQTGWNMIGNPYLHPIFLKDTCIKHGNSSSVPFGTAVTGGWTGNSIYSFNGTQYLPEIYLDPLGIKPPAVLGPWNGYWLQLLAGDAGYSLIYLDTPGACP